MNLDSFQHQYTQTHPEGKAKAASLTTQKSIAEPLRHAGPQLELDPDHVTSVPRDDVRPAVIEAK